MRCNQQIEKKSGQKGDVSCVIQPSTRSTLSVHDSCPSLGRYVQSITWYLYSCCCSNSQCTHPPSIPKQPTSSTILSTHITCDTMYQTLPAKQWKLGGDLELTLGHSNYSPSARRGNLLWLWARSCPWWGCHWERHYIHSVVLSQLTQL